MPARMPSINELDGPPSTIPEDEDSLKPLKQRIEEYLYVHFSLFSFNLTITLPMGHPICAHLTLTC